MASPQKLIIGMILTAFLASPAISQDQYGYTIDKPRIWTSAKGLTAFATLSDFSWKTREVSLVFSDGKTKTVTRDQLSESDYRYADQKFRKYKKKLVKAAERYEPTPSVILPEKPLLIDDFGKLANAYDQAMRSRHEVKGEQLKKEVIDFVKNATGRAFVHNSAIQAVIKDDTGDFVFPASRLFYRGKKKSDVNSVPSVLLFLARQERYCDRLVTTKTVSYDYPIVSSWHAIGSRNDPCNFRHALQFKVGEEIDADRVLRLSTRADRFLISGTIVEARFVNRNEKWRESTKRNTVYETDDARGQPSILITLADVKIEDLKPEKITALLAQANK